MSLKCLLDGSHLLSMLSEYFDEFSALLEYNRPGSVRQISYLEPWNITPGVEWLQKNGGNKTICLPVTNVDLRYLSWRALKVLWIGEWLLASHTLCV